jgi:hypothetical protein
VTAKSSLDVPYRNFAVVCGQSRAKGRSGIALNQSYVGFEAMARIFYCVHYAAGEHTEGLIRTHDVKVEIGLDFEVFEHRAMLTRVHHGRFEFVHPAAQVIDHDGKLDRLRSRAQNSDHLATLWQLRSLHGKGGRTRRATRLTLRSPPLPAATIIRPHLSNAYPYRPSAAGPLEEYL